MEKKIMNLKIIGSFILITSLLGGCGNLKEKKEVILSEPVNGAIAMDVYQSEKQLQEQTGKWKNDNKRTFQFDKGFVCKVMEVNDTEGMVLLKAVNGLSKGNELWVSVNDLKEATNKK